MLIDACTMFKCQHEWVVLPGALLCHKCTLRRQELDLSKDRQAPPQLKFFPQQAALAP
jgi:hypothetical protein